MNSEKKKAVEFLYSIPKFTTKNSLDHTRDLMHLLGDPCLDRKIIHVAGSNGKGSVCCFLYNMLLRAGKSTALFTSPHLVDINERFRINGSQIDDDSFMKAFHKVKNAAEELVRNKKNHPTFFEFIFAMGMVIFEASGVEYVVLETGLGGRLDATNSFPVPLLTIITSISLEHTEILGNTIAQIAGEKAGILKPQIPLVFDEQAPEAAAVIRQRAGELKAPCVGITDGMLSICEINKNFIDFFLSTDYDSKTKWRVPFSAAYQVKNAAIAIMAMRLLRQIVPGFWEMDSPGSSGTDSGAYDIILQQGLLSAVWPGRMQEVLSEIYFDGAHNVSGISVFVDAVKQLVQEDKEPPLLLFSMVKEKDVETAIKILTEHVPWDFVCVTTIPGERGIPFEKLKSLFEQTGSYSVCGTEDYRAAFHAMCARKKPGQKLFCTGSLYFIGALMEVMKEDVKDTNQAD